MANLLGGVWSIQHRGVFLRHSAFVVPPVFPSQGMVISYILKRVIVIVVFVRLIPSPIQVDLLSRTSALASHVSCQ